MKKSNKMKIFSLIAFFCFAAVSILTASSAMAWYNGGGPDWTWQYRKPIVIQGSQVDDSLDPVIIENGGVGTSSTGVWMSDDTASGISGIDHSYNDNAIASSYSWRTDFEGETRNLDVSQWWAADASRSNVVKVELIDSTGVIETLNIDQTANGNQWNSLSTKNFDDFAEVKVYSAGNEAYVEAESGTIVAPMSIDSGYGATYVESDTWNDGTVTYTVDIAVAGDYKLVGRVNDKYSWDGGTGSFYYQVDGGSDRSWIFYDVGGDIVNNGQTVGDPWDYDEAGYKYGTDPYIDNLSVGTHTIRFTAYKSGTKLDYFYLVNTSAPPSTVSADAVKFIDNAGSRDLENYALLFNTGAAGDPDLAANLLDSTGGEIVFTHIDPSDGIEKKLDHEVENYESATGELVSWVRIPSLGSSDKTIYMYYNATVFDQWNPEGVWDSDEYKGVYHFGEDDSDLVGRYNAGAYNDSTANNNDGDDMNLSTGRDGKIGKGDQFEKLPGQYNYDSYIILGEDEKQWNLYDKSYTLESWFKIDPSPAAGTYNPTNNCWGINGSYTYNIFQNWFGCNAVTSTKDSGGFYCRMETDGKLHCIHEGESDKDTSSPVVLPDDAYIETEVLSKDTWHHMSFVIDQPSKIATLYIDGVEVGVDQFGSLFPYSGLGDAKMYLGGTYRYDEAWDGFLDEMRVVTASRSSGWVRTQFRNQNDPSSFYNVLAEESNSVPRPPDTFYPGRADGFPTGSWSMPKSKTDTIISLKTDENATCKYSKTPGTAFGDMTEIFYTSMSGLMPELSAFINGYSPDNKGLYVKRGSNPTQSDYDCANWWGSSSATCNLSFYTGQSGLPYHIGVYGEAAGSYQVSGTLTDSGSQPPTDDLVSGVTKSDLVGAGDWDYYVITATPLGVTAAGRDHYAVVPVDPSGLSYDEKYYVKCQDEVGNANTTDYEINFTVTGIQDGGIWQHYSTYSERSDYEQKENIYKSSSVADFSYYSGWANSTITSWSRMHCTNLGTVSPPPNSTTGACTTSAISMRSKGAIFADIAGSYNINPVVDGSNAIIYINGKELIGTDVNVDLNAGWNDLQVNYNGDASRFELKWTPPWRTSSENIPSYYLTPQNWITDNVINIPDTCDVAEDPDRCAEKVDYRTTGVGTQTNPTPTIELSVAPGGDFPADIVIGDLRREPLIDKAYVVMMYEEDLSVFDIAPMITNNNLPLGTGTCDIDGQTISYSNPAAIVGLTSITPSLTDSKSSRVLGAIPICLVDDGTSVGSPTGNLSFTFSDVQGRGGIGIIIPFIYPVGHPLEPSMSKGFVRMQFAATSGYHAASNVIAFDIDGNTEKLAPTFMIDDGETKVTWNNSPASYRPNYLVMKKGNSATTPKPGPFDILKTQWGSRIVPESSADLTKWNENSWYLAMGREGEQFDVVSSNYRENRAYGGYIEPNEGLIPDQTISGYDWVAFQYYGSNMDPDSPKTSSNYNSDGQTGSGESGFLAGGGVFTVDATVPSQINFCREKTPGISACLDGKNVGSSTKSMAVGGTDRLMACLYISGTPGASKCKNSIDKTVDAATLWQSAEGRVSISAGADTDGYRIITGIAQSPPDDTVTVSNAWGSDSVKYNIIAGGSCGPAGDSGAVFCTKTEVQSAGQCSTGAPSSITEATDLFSWTCTGTPCSVDKGCTLNKSWKEVAP